MRKRIAGCGLRGVSLFGMAAVLMVIALVWTAFPLSGRETTQEVKIEDVVEMSLDDLLNVKVTVASKSEEKIDDAPSSVTVFTSKDIREMGIR
ncbi:MAG: hypothetical protein GY765_27825, partial [bacterium]|nr:hypothetical protein [bacterium]